MDGNKEIEEAVAAHVDDDKYLVEAIGSRLAESVHLLEISSREDGPTIVIPRVPDRLHKGAKDAYEPPIVSIGPYHVRKEGLEPMQLQKWGFLQQILDRNPKKQLNDYILAIMLLEEPARSCYDFEVMDRFSRMEFVQMLLLDGCFLVYRFLPVMDRTEEKEEIFSVAWGSSQVLSDLLILENQIPFFILQRIYELAIPTTHYPPSFTQIAIKFCNYISHYIPKRMRPPPAAEIRHFLHLYHMHTLWPRKWNSEFYFLSGPSITFRELKLIVWSVLYSLIHNFNIGCLKKKFPKRKFSPTPRPRNRVRSMPSATELSESGVKLKVNPRAKSILDVRFSSRGVLEIPHLFIHDLTDSYFRNLIAFEQLFPYSGLHFTAYVNFLNSIVKMPEDVALLYRNDIIRHPSLEKEMVVDLFSRLATETTEPLENDQQDLYEEVVRCYMKRRRKWRATRHKWWAILVHDYFSSPWSVMSLAAAIILLLLTFLQTYYSMYSYSHPSP